MAALVAVALSSWACSSSSESDEDEATVIGTDVGVFRLEVGTCLNMPEGAALQSGVETLESTPCDGTPSGQVVAVATLDGADGETFPGAEAVQSDALQRCIEHYNTKNKWNRCASSVSTSAKPRRYRSVREPSSPV